MTCLALSIIVVLMKNITEVKDVQPKARILYGRKYEPTNTQGTYNAEITKTSIRIFGTMTNHVNGTQSFDRTFKLGDGAEYNSYNLKYVGTITQIGQKTVTIKHYEHSTTVTRLDLYSFIDRNWDFDSEAIARHNATEMLYI